MNITCDQCGKRYKMKAEQMKKAFKTKCKRCSNVIIVRPEAQEDQAVSQQAPVQAQSTTADSAIWYVVINGQQSGPYAPEQLGDYLANGAIDQQSFVWREGMASWETLSAVGELQSLFRQATPAPVTSAQVTHTPSVESQVVSAEVQNPVAQQAVQTELKTNQAAQVNPALSMGIQIGHSRDLLAQVKAESPSPQESAPIASSLNVASSSNAASAMDSLGQLSNQRNENSVLFSLDSIDAMSGNVEVKNQAPSQAKASSSATPLVTNTGGSEGSGLIDLSALSALTGNGPQAGGSGGAPIKLSVGIKSVGGKRSLTNSSTDFKSIALAVSSTALVLVLGLIGYQKYLAPAPI
jgi:DNA-directed RNA polymerase subunit RPC12/RpoP